MKNEHIVFLVNMTLDKTPRENQFEIDVYIWSASSKEYNKEDKYKGT
jgi:hypothetical protein